jgi:hypothetical protein
MVKNFMHDVQTGSGVHPTSSLMGTGGSFPGIKRPGRKADHGPPTNDKVKKTWIYTSTPHTPSWLSVNWLSAGTALPLPIRTSIYSGHIEIQYEN